MVSQLRVKVSGEKVSAGTITERVQRRKDNVWTQQEVAASGLSVDTENTCDPMLCVPRT